VVKIRKPEISFFVIKYSISSEFALYFKDEDLSINLQAVFHSSIFVLHNNSPPTEGRIWNSSSLLLPARCLL
jgi:hypothetical protein